MVGVFRKIQEEFGKIKVLITKSTDARGILKPQSVIPQESGITDFGFNIPWAPVLLVLI